MNKYIICFSGNSWFSLDVDSNEFSEEIKYSYRNTYITFQTSDFIRYLKSENKKHVPSIINLESFDKQFSQSGKDILDHTKWHILKSLRRENIISQDYKIDHVKHFLILIKDFYEKLFSNSDEIDRFDKIEISINKIIYETQLLGIKVDQEKVKIRCKELHFYLYELKNTLQFDYNIFQPEYPESQLKYLKSKNYRILKSSRKTISLLRNRDVICNLFHEINKTSQDLKSLIFINARYGGSECVHPNYIGFGTITSRITIKEPSLQNLKKTNRDIIIPATGKKLLYIDYSQYEAGILAHFSNDEKLLTLYNESDIYNDIAHNIIAEENIDRRKEAKILFYRYLYGDDFSSNVKNKKNIDKYFEAFTGLSEFKNQLIKKCNVSGIAETPYGNYRKLNFDTENVWILSHYIQSIASYIFKKALIEVSDRIKQARLLVPLHDGALYEVDEYYYDNIEKEVKNIFITVLKTECPRLKNANAEIKDFYSQIIDEDDLI
ncbi:DNA polymerase [Flavobacterium sp. 245]|uniref:DNA polymerase n=1 Tax=Flavobacterium sp. 245 TaxID=2512115 RepID=UPI00105CB826|nr:DNA polymerase [Flavobacterium sp. 245]TDO96086.1 DNA polymerase I-like protein with 3'-5' exonuclease and polymerase domains [Flavobacterium sp. 245]